MTFLNNLSAGKKFAAGFAAVVLTVLAMCAIVLFNVVAIGTAVTQNDAAVARLQAADDILKALVERQNAVRGFVASGDPAFEKKVADAAESYGEAIARLQAIAPAHADQIADVMAKAEAVDKIEKQEMARSSLPGLRGEVAAGLATTGRLTEVREAMQVIIDKEAADLKVYAQAQTDTQRTAITVLLIGGVAAALISAVMGWLLARAIGAPLTAMTAAMRSLAAGDNTVEIPAADRKDEIGAMAGAVQVFKDAAIEKLRLEGMTAEQAKAAEEERARNEAAKAEAARQQAQVVDSIAQGLSKLSAGDLVFRITQPFSSEYEKLRADFNGAMEQLQETMKVITAATQGIRSGTDEISQAADDLSKRTEQQAASLEETAAALDEITATVRKTAEGANHAREVVGTAKTDAEHSGQVVRDAVAAMSEIEKSAQQISQIIGVIDEIAFQTNLLALNAGVEAARAGDAGKGFAVVASEVRALAQRSADAAKEIKTLISASSQQVGSGVALVGETGEALNRIVAQVADINNVVAEIAASAQEQATGLNQVNTAVNQMDQVTQQNAAMVEQSTAASHSLATETEELARLVSRFQVGGAAVQMARAPAQPLAKPRPPVAALKTVSTHSGGGGALARPTAAPAADVDNWEEF